MCPSLEAAVSLKVHSLACDAPIRDRAPVVTGAVLSLFILATVMILLRVLARCPWIGGPGYAEPVNYLPYLLTVMAYQIRRR